MKYEWTIRRVDYPIQKNLGSVLVRLEQTDYEIFDMLVVPDSSSYSSVIVVARKEILEKVNPEE
jgi:hypothetical protein